MVVTGPTATSRSGFRAFLIVSAGQLVSGLGSTMSAFAVQFWVYAETDSVTNLAMIALAYTIPQVIISPFAGALVDRWDRRVVMLGADVVAAAVTAALALLYAADLLAVGHVIASVAVIGITSTFQQPAWMASIPLLVRKEQLGRANGLGQLIGGVTAVLAPLLAGAVLQFSSLQGVLLVDLATFAAAVITLAIVRFPRPAPAPAAQRRSLRAEAIHGWRFVRERPGLLGLLWTVGGVNFSLTFFNVLLLPLVLTIASNDGAAGAVLAVTGAGAIVGAAAVSAWGGPKRKVRGMMMTIAVAGVFIAVAGMRPSLVVVSATCFAVVAVIPVANTASQVIWQTKVPLEMQGRVFAIRRMISESITPLAFLIAGPLADNVFEPLLAADGGLAESIGALIGTGAGRGIGFMYLLTGLATAAMALYGYSRPRIRHLETELPDQIREEVMSHES